MIDVDTSHIPTGTLGWTRLLDGIYAADPDDESEWVEFKALPDLTDKPGRAHLARAIVAFANRDPERAARWLEGYAVIVIGLEPGRVTGTLSRDPARIHDAVQPLLTPPAPGWDIHPTTYRDKHVILVTVDPPSAGDPIHCIAKAAGNLVEDGRIYVRRPGKSEPAKSADIRRLSERLIRGQQPALDIALTAAVPGGQRRCIWPESWVDDWVSAERERLIRPMEEALRPPPDKWALLGIDNPLQNYSALSSLASQAAFSSRFADREEPEDRDPEDYQAQVESYLDQCREQLSGALPDAAARALKPARWRVENRTEHNLESVEVKVHVLGHVSAYESLTAFALRDHHPRPPRVWGPRIIRGLQHTLSNLAVPTLPAMNWDPGPSGPTVMNGGSAWFEFEPVHLRPNAAETLHSDYVLVPSPDFSGPIECEWSATATNLSGAVEGRFTIPIVEAPLDISRLLRWRDDSGGVVIRPGSEHNPWDDGWDDED